MRIAVVICTRNRPDQIGRAVRSVLQNDHDNFELVVVDQSSTDSTRDALSWEIARNANLKYLHSARAGLSPARNRGIAESNGEIVAFTDDDCAAPPDWLRRIEAAFSREPDVDLVYGSVLVPPELHDAAGGVPALAIPAVRRIGCGAERFEIYGMGANFAARRRLFERVGGFDDLLGAGCPLLASEDFDLQYRVYHAGLIRLLTPEVVLDHYGLRSPEEWPAMLRAYGTGDGAFCMKHVRCGDLAATRLMLQRIGANVLRIMVRPVLGRAHSSDYLLGFLAGMRQSFRYPVDPVRRLYAAAPGIAAGDSLGRHAAPNGRGMGGI